MPQKKPMRTYEEIMAERDKDILCRKRGLRYDGRGKAHPITIVRLYPNGTTIVRYELPDGTSRCPLIVDGKNVDRFDILEDEEETQL